MIHSTLYSEIAGVNIRPLESLEEYHTVEEAQRLIWMMPDAVQIVPTHLLITAQKNGGLVAGAFDPQGEMVGFVFGFIGLSETGSPKHCSHMLGVMPAVRRQSIGRALKLYQRQYVLQQGLELITWTFDPLEGVNASLNIARLGGLVCHYDNNLYGAMTDRLNSGLTTDRFEVEWWINSQHVEQYLEGQRERPPHSQLINMGARLVNTTRLDQDGVLHAVDCDLDMQAELLLIEVPAEFQATKAVAMDAAINWREQTAAIFTHYFRANYAVTDFITDREDGYRRNFYALTSNVKIL